jgi:hypothetical protein
MSVLPTFWYVVAGIASLPAIQILTAFLGDLWKWFYLPPGPVPPLFPLLFLGNKLPTSKPWIQFQEWSKEFGPIFTIWYVVCKPISLIMSSTI